MEEQKKTPITQLFDDMPVSIRRLAHDLGISEVTLARIRDGKPTRKPTANRLLRYFSDTYGEKYNLRNVEGITTLTFKKRKSIEEQDGEKKPSVA